MYLDLSQSLVRRKKKIFWFTMARAMQPAFLPSSWKFRSEFLYASFKSALQKSTTPL
jgi:hypothetical protein